MESIEYRAWANMRYRCLNEDAHNYHRYGGRGIKICKRWDSFENFLEDMGRRPSPGHSLDRKENNGDYEPGNCRWATPAEQGENRSTTTFLTVEGERKSLHEWAALQGVKPITLWARLQRGWSHEDAVTTPTRKRG